MYEGKKQKWILHGSSLRDLNSEIRFLAQENLPYNYCTVGIFFTSILSLLVASVSHSVQGKVRHTIQTFF